MAFPEESDIWRQDRIADLKAKLRAREGKVPYRDNVPVLKAEIARLEAIHAERQANGLF